MKNLLIVIVLLVLAVIIYGWAIHSPEEAVAPENSSQEIVTDDYIGMTTEQAQVLAVENGVLFRVVEMNGEPQPTTRDFQQGRINAVIVDGFVSQYSIESNPVLVPEVESDAENIEVINNDEIIGMTTEQAEAYASQEGVDFRIGSIDGESRPVTLDYRVGRITANIVDGIVTSYTVE